MSHQQIVNTIIRYTAELAFAIDVNDQSRYIRTFDQLTHFIRIAHDRIPRPPTIADPTQWSDEDDDDLVSPL